MKPGLNPTGVLCGLKIEHLGGNSIRRYNQKVITGREGGLAPANSKRKPAGQAHIPDCY